MVNIAASRSRVLGLFQLKKSISKGTQNSVEMERRKSLSYVARGPKIRMVKTNKNSSYPDPPSSSCMSLT